MGRPTRAETERLDTHLLDIAERHFLAHGFEGTSMDGVALEARASKRTIYHRYSGKRALFEAVIERALGRVLAVAAHEVQGATVEARLEHMAVDMIERALNHENISLLRVVVAEAGRFNEMARSLEERSYGRLVGVIADQLRTEAATHGLKLRLPLEVAAQQFLGLTQTAFALPALMGRDLAELRAAADVAIRDAVSTFLHGCCATGRSDVDAVAAPPRSIRATQAPS